MSFGTFNGRDDLEYKDGLYQCETIIVQVILFS